MRVSENRYTRDRSRLDLALRFMQHGARTQTICKWTGLTGDRIRKLHKSYLENTPDHVARHRGPSPGQASFFVRTPRVQAEASVLASVFAICGLTPTDAVADMDHPARDLALGERLCQAFEYFLIVLPMSQITFEHAVLLVRELARGVELRLDECNTCSSLVVVDPLVLRDNVSCSRCNQTQQDEAAEGPSARE